MVSAVELVCITLSVFTLNTFKDEPWGSQVAHQVARRDYV